MQERNYNQVNFMGAATKRKKYTIEDLEISSVTINSKTNAWLAKNLSQSEYNRLQDALLSKKRPKGKVLRTVYDLLVKNMKKNGVAYLTARDIKAIKKVVQLSMVPKTIKRKETNAKKEKEMFQATAEWGLFSWKILIPPTYKGDRSALLFDIKTGNITAKQLIKAGVMIYEKKLVGEGENMKWKYVEVPIKKKLLKALKYSDFTDVRYI